VALSLVGVFEVFEVALLWEKDYSHCGFSLIF